MYLRKTAVALSVIALAAVVTVQERPATAEAKAKQRLAKGKTSQKRGVALRLQPRSLRLLDFNAVLRCRDGGELIVEEGGFLTTPVKPNGKFSDVQHGRTDRVWLQGRVGQRYVRGKLRVTDRWGKVRCDSRWFKFSARIRSGN